MIWLSLQKITALCGTTLRMCFQILHPVTHLHLLIDLSPHPLQDKVLHSYNAHNAYVRELSAFNALHEEFYSKQIYDMLDELQALQEQAVEGFQTCMQKQAQLSRSKVKNFTYRIAGNFREFHGFVAIKFCERFLHQNLYFSPIREIFVHRKFLLYSRRLYLILNLDC